jgi:hypothetical protein
MTDCLDRLEEIGAVAPGGINEDRRHASGHGDHPPDWVDQSGSGCRKPDTIEQECEGHILHDLPVTVTADFIPIQHGAKPLIRMITSADSTVNAVAKAKSKAVRV